MRARLRSPPEELSGRILQQKRAKNLSPPNNVRKCKNVVESVSTNTEDNVEAFEGDQVGDGDSSLVLLLLRFRLLVIVLIISRAREDEDDKIDY